MNKFTETIKEIEEYHEQYGLDSLTFQIACQDLRLQLREYCEAHGIKEVNSIKSNKEVK